MKANLDGTVYFDETPAELVVKDWKRDYISRSVAGLDGVINIDLGKRQREIIQTGTFRAASSQALDRKTDAVNNLIDGQSHTLLWNDGNSFANLKINSFATAKRHIAGAGTSCDYKICYIQLGE